MPDTRVTEGIRLSLDHLENIIMFANRLDRQKEFEENSLARGQIASLYEALNYSEKLFKQLYQKAAAYALRLDRVIPEKEA